MNDGQMDVREPPVSRRDLDAAMKAVRTAVGAAVEVRMQEWPSWLQEEIVLGLSPAMARHVLQVLVADLARGGSRPQDVAMDEALSLISFLYDVVAEERHRTGPAVICETP